VRNDHFKFHKVVWKHYLGEVGNFYIIVKQIYSRNGEPSVIGIVEDII